MKMFITGDSRGVGKALAEHFNPSHDVVGVSTSEIDCLWKHYVCDVRNINRRTHTELLVDLKDSDILINNAGVLAAGPLIETPTENIDELMDINLITPIKLIRRWLDYRDHKYGKSQHYGCIINISSVGSIIGTNNLAAYSASKAGLDGLTRSLARELGPLGVRVNSVLPGLMNTDMTNYLDNGAKDHMLSKIPLQKHVTVEDVAATVEFLISDAARSITGQSIVVDGGYTL